MYEDLHNPTEPSGPDRPGRWRRVARHPRLQVPIHEDGERSGRRETGRTWKTRAIWPRASPKEIDPSGIHDFHPPRRSPLPADWMLTSVGLHVLVALALLFLQTPPRPQAPAELEVFNVSADELPPEVDASLPAAPPPTERFESLTREPQPLPRGQVVNLAPPEVPQSEPDRARFLAEDNHRTQRETRAPLVQVNPDVVAPRASRGMRAPGERGTQAEGGGSPEPQAEREAVAMVPRAVPTSPERAIEPPIREDAAASTEGLESSPKSADRTPDRRIRPTPARPGRKLELYPSPGQVASLLGTGGAGTGGARLGEPGLRSGAPDNDALDVEMGEETRLNARKFAYARYFNAIKRQFNYFYSQGADNLSARDIDERLFQKTYITRFNVTLSPDGRVADIRLVQSSGVDAFDHLAINAMRQASPLPAPPAELLEEGRLVIPAECRLGVGLGVPEFRPTAREGRY